MLEPSLSFAAVSFVDKEKVLGELDVFLDRLIRGHVEIVEIILFGSFATDRYAPGSDIDLLIILDHSSQSFVNRIPEFLPDRFPVSVDVFPYTKEEIDQLIREDRGFIRTALEEGQILYKRD